MNQNDLSNENGKEKSVISVVGANTAGSSCRCF